MRFQYTIHHVPGKTLYTADMLFRASLHDASDANILTPEKTEKYVEVVMASLPADQHRLDCNSKAQAENGEGLLKNRWELTLYSTLLLYNSRI